MLPYYQCILYYNYYDKDAHGIKVERFIEEVNLQVKCDKGLIVSAIMNIIDNSIYWIHREKRKEIYIACLDNKKNHRINILIADNRPGFLGEPEDLIRPFVSNKPKGLELGLNIVNEILNLQGGQLIFPSDDMFEVPNSFDKGAKIVLSIPKYEGEQN